MSELNLEVARYNMIEQQIRPWDVLDQSVLDLIASLPREEFVPEDYRNLAFADTQIPLGHEQVMMSPKLEGRLLQALMLNPNDSVLEIGTGSGFFTALLARAAKIVETVDIFDDFVQEAATKLKRFGINNVILNSGDAAQGWQADRHYDVIVLTASVPLLPVHFQQQLNDGGCLLAIVGEAPIMQAQLITRINEHELIHDILFETFVPPLIHAPQPQRFVL